MLPRPRLDEALDALRAKGPLTPAFVEADGRVFTIADFDALVQDTLLWLKKTGVHPGDRVAVWLVNRIEWLGLLFALARLGATLVAVNTRYRSAELHHILKSSGASLLILQPGFKRIDFAEVLSTLDFSDLDELKALAVFAEDGIDAERFATLSQRPVHPFDVTPRQHVTTPGAPDRASDPAADVAFFTTSGTTKAPKLVVHVQRTIGLHSLRAAKAYGFDQPGCVFLAAMPYCGVFGLNSQLAAIAGGAPSHILPVFETGEASARIAQAKVTHLVGSDEMFRRLAEAGMDKLASTRLCGFATFTPGLSEVLAQRMAQGLPLVGLYGSSEVNAIFSIHPVDFALEERLKGGGRLTSRDATVRARDGVSGEILPAGAVGDLEISAPTSFVRYHRNPEATRDAMTEDGFFRTGDIGYLREDGSFVYVARAGDAIRLSGFLVDPAEIEDTLKTLPQVADAQVVGVEADGQMRALAFIIPVDAARFSEETLLADARAVLASFKVPLRAFALAAFPVTQSANGPKIQRAKLRQMAADLVNTPKDTA